MIPLCQRQAHANRSTECGNHYFPDYFIHSGSAYCSYYVLHVVPDYLEASEHYYITAALAQNATPDGVCMVHLPLSGPTTSELMILYVQDVGDELCTRLQRVPSEALAC
jgi:hypothetical protein